MKKKILEMNRANLLSQIKSYKKLDLKTHENDKFERKPYLRNLNINQARLKFKLSTKMTPTVMMNFPSDPYFAHKLWTCSGCSDGTAGEKVTGSRDTQQHIMVCDGYAELRTGKNMDNDGDLVKYFSDVIKIRQEKHL